MTPRTLSDLIGSGLLTWRVTDDGTVRLAYPKTVTLTPNDAAEARRLLCCEYCAATPAAIVGADDDRPLVVCSGHLSELWDWIHAEWSDQLGLTIGDWPPRPTTPTKETRPE